MSSCLQASSGLWPRSAGLSHLTTALRLRNWLPAVIEDMWVVAEWVYAQVGDGDGWRSGVGFQMVFDLGDSARKKTLPTIRLSGWGPDELQQQRLVRKGTSCCRNSSAGSRGRRQEEGRKNPYSIWKEPTRIYMNRDAKWIGIESFKFRTSIDRP